MLRALIGAEGDPARHTFGYLHVSQWLKVHRLISNLASIKLERTHAIKNSVLFLL